MNYDDFQSDGEGTPQPHQHHLLDDDIPEDDDAWRSQHRSPTPVYDMEPSETKSKPRKRLIKKSHATTADEDPIPNFVVDEDEDVDEGFEREGSVGGKRKKVGGSGKKEKRHKGEKKFGVKGSSASGFSRRAARDRDGEVKEMWDTIAGGDSEVIVIIQLLDFWSSK